MNQHIFIGTDHGGYAFKADIIRFLQEQNTTVDDCGAYELNTGDDYPAYAFAVGEKVADLEKQQQPVAGVLLCRSGAGVTIAANKVQGIRAATAFTVQQVKHAREHDNINVLTLSGDWLSLEEMKQLITVFLETPFSGSDRHQRRLSQITAYEHK